ncbi:MAG: methyltransferase domain-containing protein [Desulfobacterales bacterium]
MNITDVPYWENAWKDAGNSSFLRNTQKAEPDRWFAFYNEVSDIYLSLWDHRDFGNRAAKLFLSEGLIRHGSRVLDAGCGPGTLAIPLAEQGMEVTGLDYSPGMLKTLRENAQTRKLDIRTCCQAFGEYMPEKKYDLVCAAFFPPCLEPEGIARLESWSDGWCAVMIGAGEISRPLHKALWQTVMNKEGNTEPHCGRFHLICLMGYLLARGRKPCIRYISQKYQIRRPFAEMLRFYKSYFSIFGCSDVETEQQIRCVLQSFSVPGSDEENSLWVAAGEENCIGVVWWKAL